MYLFSSKKKVILEEKVDETLVFVVHVCIFLVNISKKQDSRSFSVAFITVI